LRAIKIQTADGREISEHVDLLAVAGGWTPAIGLGCHLGARPAWNKSIQAYALDDPPAHIRLAGAVAGALSLGAALTSGVSAAETIAEDLGLSMPHAVAPRADDEPCGVAPLLQARAPTHKAFVDLQHDVTTDDVALAAREGFVSVEHMKRYTTLGMA